VVLMIALLRDRDLARVFLDRELGELAAAGQRQDDLRHVTRTYLESGQSTVATASKLGCNRRTVERKLKQAEGLIGHLLWQRSAEVLLALTLSGLT
jgi:DNA-binding PucR family transcriptional regulator